MVILDETWEPISINELSAFHDGRPRVAVAVQAYYDGSNNAAGKPRSVTLAGYAGTPDFWAYFEACWKSVLAGDGHRPSASYLHMSEANALWGEFSAEKGWTERKVQALLGDVAQSLSAGWDEYRDHFIGVSCTVRLDDYERALLALPQLEKKEPEAICVDYCVTPALQVLPEAPVGRGILGKLGSVELYFDRNEEFHHKVNRMWGNKKFSQRSKPLRLVHQIGQVDMKKTPPLQAADYLAWLTNRHLSGQDLAAGVRRVLSAPMVGIEFDYATLMERYKDWRAD